MDADDVSARWRLAVGADVVLLDLGGEWDMAARSELSEAVAAVGDCRRLTIDLEDVTFLDGGGLDVLLELAHLLSDRGVDVRFGPRSRRVDRYLELTGTTLTA